MALSKAIALPTGATANYHRIDADSIVFSLGTVRFSVQSFLTAQARTDGKIPAKTASFCFSREELFPVVEVDGKFWEKLYSALKTLDTFDGASDC